MKKLLIHASVLVLLLFFPSQPVGAQLRGWNDDINLDVGGTQSCMVDGVPTLKCLEIVVGNLVFLANGLIIIVLFIMFLIGSFKWLTSLGSAEKIEEAKGTFKWAIIGLVVYVSAYLIINTIGALFLGGSEKLFEFKIGE